MARGDQRKTVEVLVPGPLSEIRSALVSCAFDGNKLAIDIMETIRRSDDGEEVGTTYAAQMNEFMAEHFPPVIRAHDLSRRRKQ